MTTITNRFNTLLLLLIALMAAGIITMLATRAYGGPLDPPGAPASTDGVSGPGTPISSLPFVINAPGYYYVTRPLTGAVGGNGITINLSDVTVDLGGFTLTGGSGAGSAILVQGVLRNVTIRNGALRGWGRGVDAQIATDSRIDNVQASSNDAGFWIGAHSEISDCNASLNRDTGIIIASGVVRNCTISENDRRGIIASDSLIEGNKVQNNFMVGIELSGSRSTLRNNELSLNTVRDIVIDVGGSSNAIIGNVNCSFTDNGTGTQFAANINRC